MGLLSVSFSIDQSQHLVAVVQFNEIPDAVSTLIVESGLFPTQPKSFTGFTDLVDLGAASAGVFLVTLTLNGADTCGAVVSISGPSGQWSVISGTAVPATGNAFGFDTDGPIPQKNLAVLKSTFNYSFCVRYVSRGVPYTKDISAAEVATCLSEDVALMLVQHPPAEGWTPTANNGTLWGEAAASNSIKACVPAGVSLFCDLEGVAPHASATDIIDFCNNWYTAVINAGYTPGLYVGSNCGLTADQLSSLSFQIFWKSCSRVPTPQQGFVMSQYPCAVIRGDGHAVSVSVDEDTIAGAPGGLMWLRQQIVRDGI